MASKYKIGKQVHGRIKVRQVSVGKELFLPLVLWYFGLLYLCPTIATRRGHGRMVGNPDDRWMPPSQHSAAPHVDAVNGGVDRYIGLNPLLSAAFSIAVCRNWSTGP